MSVKGVNVRERWARIQMAMERKKEMRARTKAGQNTGGNEKKVGQNADGH